VKTEDVPQLQGLIRSLVWALNGTEYQEHIGTKYIPRKGPKGEHNVVYGWLFCFMGPDPLQMSRLVCGAIEEVFPPLEVMESPLMGPGTPQSGGSTSGKKGAAPVR
jgi:hypothetical protein